MEGNEDYDGTYSVDDENQLQPSDTLDDRGVEDVLDEGYVARDDWSPAMKHGITPADLRQGASLDEQLSWEEAEPTDDDWDEENLDDQQVGDVRSGRLIASSDDDDRFVTDVGIDGAGASAEEAAMHVIDDY